MTDKKKNKPIDLPSSSYKIHIIQHLYIICIIICHVTGSVSFLNSWFNSYYSVWSIGVSNESWVSNILYSCSLRVTVQSKNLFFCIITVHRHQRLLKNQVNHPFVVGYNKRRCLVRSRDNGKCFPADDHKNVYWMCDILQRASVLDGG